ncbi:glycoside hydrolase family 16 protein [Aureicoccus marinus]|uniref:Beta-glucanase n=1 Tax=Aureicoccus marinus TaxID=754435 RepID=A0A2S7T9V8_9FLAO|nr:glycoside hydrolase family 16 protein [Aureicoccus marinus]PQJ16722.1 beta-glucanase [Aureicoccus marinus]
MKWKAFVLGVFFVLVSCGTTDTPDVPEPNTDIIPANLTVEVVRVGSDSQNPNGDGSGEVLLSANADNAVRFTFQFSDGQLIESNTGQVQYRHDLAGTRTYAVLVKAISETGNELALSRQYQVFVSSELFSTLVFSDEFDEDGALDPEKWHHQIIPPQNGGWFNGEQQHYTDRLDNSYVSDGTLKIVAKKETYTTQNSTREYTSARLNSIFTFQYGRVEVRAKTPSRGGTWPAIWTLGANINEIGNYHGTTFGSVGWPACGEIDIMEQKGWDKTRTIGFFHWGNTNTGAYQNEGGEIDIAGVGTDFHIYSLEWTENSMRVEMDGQLIYELSNTQDKPFDNPHYLLLNIAMGGNLGGDIPANFTEDVMEIDYVRVYQ